MQRITKTEIRWIIGFLEKECKSLLSEFDGDFDKNPFGEIAKLRHDNFKSLYEKLERVIDTGDKRIEVESG